MKVCKTKFILLLKNTTGFRGRRFVIFSLLWCCFSPNLILQAADLQEKWTGIWLGTLEIPNAHIRLTYRIKVDAKDSIIVIHDSPDYGFTNIPVHRARVRGDSIYVDISLYNAFFKGKVRKNRINGKYKHNGPWIGLNLNRVKPNPDDLLDYMVPRLDSSGKRVLEYHYSLPKAGKEGWETENIGKTAIEFKPVKEFVDLVLREEYPNVHSLVIIKNGKLVLDEYFHGYTKNRIHPIHSNTKSVICLLTGIALQNGIIEHIDMPLHSIFKEYDDIFQEKAKKEITLKHVLSMSSGLQWDEASYSYYDPRNDVKQLSTQRDIVRYVLEKPVQHSPGTFFTYNSGMMVVLAKILQRSTDQNTQEYARAVLFEPLKISEYLWEYYQDGNIRGGGGLHLRTRDLAKLAYLYMHKGKWKKQQLINPSWFDDCEILKRDCGQPSYWNHWGEGYFKFDNELVSGFNGGGFGGQVIYGFPQYDLVVAMTAGNYLGGFNYNEIIEDYILPAVARENQSEKTINRQIPHKSLNNLDWEECIVTPLACVKSCLNYMKNDVSMGWLFGASGYAFSLNMNQGIGSNSVGAWNSERSRQLCKNIGVEIETIAAGTWDSRFREHQEHAWISVKNAIDQGIPCYGFHMNIPEHYLIYGYNDRGYFYKGWDSHTGYGPKCWNELGLSNIGWLEVQIARKCTTSSDIKTIRDALQYAVDYAQNPEQFTYNGFSGGLLAYDTWINALEQKKADPFGLVYNSAFWFECRRQAMHFLVEAQSRIASKNPAVFAKAIKNYEEVSENLSKVCELFPYGSPSRKVKKLLDDSTNVKQAIFHLQKAKHAEVEGIKSIEELLQTLD